MTHSDVTQYKRSRIAWRDLIDGADWPQVTVADGELFPQVYIILDSIDTPIYVGSSRSVFARLLSHVGEGFTPSHVPTTVGEYIMENMPQSLDWNIELLHTSKHSEADAIRAYTPWFNATNHDRYDPVRPTPKPVARHEQAKKRAAGKLHVPAPGQLF